MYSNTADCSSSRDGQLRRLTSSFLSVAKNVSATALSYTSPREPIETAIPASRATRPNARLTYCPPWSEWWVSPGQGRRRASAIFRASTTRLARMWVAIDQPTISREVGVLDRGEVQPALAGAQVGDV